MLVTETFLQKQYQRANILVPVGHRFPWALECYVSVCPAHLCTKHWQEEATVSALTGGPHSARVNLEELKRHDCKEGIMNISTPGLASSNQISVNFPRYVVHGSEDAPQTENSHMCIFHEKRGGLGGSRVQSPGTEWLGTLNSVHMGNYIFFFSVLPSIPLKTVNVNRGWGQKLVIEPGMVAHGYIPSSWEADAGGSRVSG